MGFEANGLTRVHGASFRGLHGLLNEERRQWGAAFFPVLSHKLHILLSHSGLHQFIESNVLDVKIVLPLSQHVIISNVEDLEAIRDAQRP